MLQRTAYDEINFMNNYRYTALMVPINRLMNQLSPEAKRVLLVAEVSLLVLLTITAVLYLQ
ncbi:MAG: hypothetical protein OXE78_14495 [Gammaproteobacteria bacterium]|nr:hypothetical protein [Gammaproteobacteria bacterium]